jgi:hypothetical protein
VSVTIEIVVIIMQSIDRDSRRASPSPLHARAAVRLRATTIVGILMQNSACWLRARVTIVIVATFGLAGKLARTV